MRSHLSLWLLLCLPAFLSTQRVIPPAYRISGVVVNARDGSPVRHGQVTANKVEPGRNNFREPLRTETDDTGHFQLEVSSDGDWQVSVSAHNIRTQSFENHEGYFSGVVLTQKAPAYNLIFHAIPDAILSGNVTDEAGEPVRDAQVSLFSMNKSALQTGGQPLQQRQRTQTDDRGHYEFAALEAGSYLVEVQARPWYTNFAPTRTSTGSSGSQSPDPSLDVVYPRTWYPSGSEISAAATLTANPGDSLQADVRLLPLPSAHLIIPANPLVAGQQGPDLSRPGQRTGNLDPPPAFPGNATVALILPNGTTEPVFGQVSTNQHGDVEIGGLAPGTYQVTVPGSPESPSRTRTVQISAGSTSIELGAALPTTPVTISVDGDGRTRASQIILRSTTTGQTFPDTNFQEMRNQLRGPGGPATDTLQGRPATPQRSPQPNTRSRAGQTPGAGPRTRGRTPSDSNDSIVQVPPGEYEVSVSGSPNAFLAGVSAKGATVVGRTVTISESPAFLSVHLGTGFATVEGIASIDGKTCVGAMVLLVPATLGDRASLVSVYRDQSNTDGSFRMDRVVPGPYILVAIDHGWSVQWTDADTLRPYLMRGFPLDLAPFSVANPKLIALKP